MLRAGPAGKKSRKDSTISSVGIEFVDSIFEKDGRLENTEKFMESVRCGICESMPVANIYYALPV